MKTFNISLIVLLMLGCNIDPKPCGRCSATGKVTRSYKAPLPGRVTRCESDFKLTGFLGLGEGKYITTISAVNDGDKPGRFTLSVRGGLPGQLRADAVTLKSTEVHIGAHQEITQRFEFRPSRVENISLLCSVKRPLAVQSAVSVCDACAGRGAK